LRYHPRLRRLAHAAADQLADRLGDQLGAPATTAVGHRGRGTGPALPARIGGLPAITLGALDAHGLAPRSHRRDDTVAQLDPAAMDGVLEFALTLADALHAEQ
jgi:hypothetical protein